MTQNADHRGSSGQRPPTERARVEARQWPLDARPRAPRDRRQSTSRPPLLWGPGDAYSRGLIAAALLIVVAVAVVIVFASLLGGGGGG